jgi:signal transduction histidine kinase
MFNFFGTKEGKKEENETTHINQEVYKRSVELSEQNRTLSLLRKIDEIILGAVTNQREIAQQVASLLVQENDFYLVSILVLDHEKQQLIPIAFAQAVPNAQNSQPSQAFLPQIALTQTTNVVVQSVIEKKVKVAHTLVNVLCSPLDQIVLAPYNVIKSVFVFPLFARNEVIGAMVVCFAIDETRITADERTLLNRLISSVEIAMYNSFLYDSLKRSNKRFQQLDKLKNEFVSLASHELRTPMTAVRSYLAIIGDATMGGPLNANQQEYLKNALVATDRLIQLVNDMLNISRIESGRLEFSIKSVNVRQLVEEVMKEVLPQMNELGIQLLISPVSIVPMVLADADKIKEVLINLIGNAMKFTPKGGRVTISLTTIGDMVEITITDTGCGIDPEDISKLFQKFSMIPGAYSLDQPKGTGLGLYISKAIIEGHKGKISAQSAGIGKGTAFTFSLPKVMG